MYCQINSLILWSKPSNKYFCKVMWPRINTPHCQSKVLWAQLIKCICILLSDKINSSYQYGYSCISGEVFSIIDIGKLDIEDKYVCQYLWNLLSTYVYAFWNIEEEKHYIEWNLNYSNAPFSVNIEQILSFLKVHR